ARRRAPHTASCCLLPACPRSALLGLLLLFGLDLDRDLRALPVRVAEPEDQRARADRVLQRDLEAALVRDPRAVLGGGLLADLVEQLDLRALRRRDAGAVDDAGQAPVEAVALAVLEHRDGLGDPQRLLTQRHGQARGAAARGLLALHAAVVLGG